MSRKLTRILSSAVCLASLAGAPLLAQGICDGVAPSNNTTLAGVEVVSGLTGRPVLVTAPPGDTDRIFIVEQDGFVRVKQRGSAPGVYSTFLDISAVVELFGDEQGLLAMVFDPNYDTNGYFYVYYVRDTPAPQHLGLSIVARYTRDATDPNLADPTTSRIVLQFLQLATNHNGGHLEFGSDGYLYFTIGDGGSGGDPWGADTCGNGQNPGTIFGSMVRIDPHESAGGLARDCGFGNYTIPADNPLADGAGGDCDEIWAYGLRNPWRYDFDEMNDDLYIADVGQNCWEEIDWVPGSSTGGENYGWRSMEGDHCYTGAGCDPTGQTCGSNTPCNDASLTDPVHEFSSAGSIPCSVTGGYVYRGCRMPNFEGTYFYGDYCQGSIRSLEMQAGVATNLIDTWASQIDPGATLFFGLTSFGQDARGELYVTDRSGSVLKIMPPYPFLEVSGAGAADQFLLNRTGNWGWEDVEYNTMAPTNYYRVYRGVPNGTFDCIHSTFDTDWATGDTTDPSSGQLLAYVVTAVTPTPEQETSSGSPARTLANPCASP